MKKKIYLLALLASALPSGAGLMAQDDLFTMSLEELMALEVVTATRTAERLMDAPAVVTVITREDIERYGYQDLAQVLARVPEVYAHFEGHNTNVDFRGFFSNNTQRRILFLVDGMKLNDNFHFGDFYADLVNDLSFVERIEVIRGPGAALYGNNSVLGVVNIITRQEPGVSLRLNAPMLGQASQALEYALDLRQKHGDFRYALHLDWFSGQVAYDTRTDWYNAYGQDGVADFQFGTDFYLRADNSAERQALAVGAPAPNFKLDLAYGDFTVGAFLFSRRSNWVWPKDNVTFNHPENDRAWGSGSAFIRYEPRRGWLADKGFRFELWHNANTNREVAAYDVQRAVPRLSGAVFANAFSSDSILSQGQAAFLLDPDGDFYEYVSAAVRPSDLDTARLVANGGGAKFVYQGVDHVTDMNFLLSPIAREKLNVMLGGNFKVADYQNYQRFSYANNAFIGWARWGGISAQGSALGAFAQAIYTPWPAFSVIAGLRFDQQTVDRVFRQLGGELRYSATAWQDGLPTGFEPILAEDRVASDLTPRLALNYRFSDRTNLRLIYAQAFRAVPSQEINRLPLAFGDAQSEKTTNYEAALSTMLGSSISLVANAFHLVGSEIYQWNSAVNSFTKGTGWHNTGGSLALAFRPLEGIEAWANATYYALRKPTDTYNFFRDPQGVLLPNQYEALDSPSFLLKMGASRHWRTTGTLLALEMLHNGKIQSYHPADPASGAYFFLHQIPASTQFNLNIGQDFAKLGFPGVRASVRVDNVLGQDVWNVMPFEAEATWAATSYERPHQLPGFGRRFYLSASYAF